MVKKKESLSSSSPSEIRLIFQGVIAFGAALLILLCLLTFQAGHPEINSLGLCGHWLAWGLRYCLGLSAFVIPICLSFFGYFRLFHHTNTWLKELISSFGLLCSLSSLLAMLSRSNPLVAHHFERWAYVEIENSTLIVFLGGIPFDILYQGFKPFCFAYLLGSFGSFLFFFSLLIGSFVVLTGWKGKNTFFFLKKCFSRLKSLFIAFLQMINEKVNQKRVLKQPHIQPEIKAPAKEPEIPFSRPHPLTQPPLRFVTPEVKKEEKKDLKTPSPTLPPTKEMAKYVIPSGNLLTQVKKTDSSSLKNDLRRFATTLEETLQSFGIEAKVGDIHLGPTITLFEVHPAVGVKVQKIKTLENDIALNMQAKSIRIIAPIPGKAAVGIEVPNPFPQEVGFRDMLENYQSSGKKGHIPLLLGKAVTGEDVWSDLTKMPHCIIAGATGSGKSVCINTIVMSILMNARPDEIKLVMVDPKKVELTAYSQLPHMLAPVITEPKEAHAAFLWLVKEMERRYEIFRLMGIRNIFSFNTRKIDVTFESSLEISVPERLPYIVVIVDELADLMMVSSNDIETPIARIAQMARAVGIHLILATQRPSREVITGLIKANFPTRIAFKVSSRVNSQIVIDENGAESLLGNGDMLFMPPGSSNLIRVQGAYIRDEDINKTIEAICAQMPANYLIPSFQQLRVSEDDQKRESETEENSDPLYEEAKKLVLETGNASTTFLQRKLKIGYARAASLMDELENKGIIGPQEGAKPRKIFYPSAQKERTRNEDTFETD